MTIVAPLEFTFMQVNVSIEFEGDSSIFSEKSLVEKIILEEGFDEDKFISVANNFKSNILPGYEEKKVAKSNKGRKPKQKKKLRKTEGTGDHMASQTTFIYFYEQKQYKLKVYNNGSKIQICSFYEDGRDKNYILPKLNNLLIDNSIIDDNFTIVDESITLMNFKSEIIIPTIGNETVYIDINYLYRLIEDNKEDFIYNIDPGDDMSTLVVKLDDPKKDDPEFKLKVSIFQTGKINILGGHNKQTPEKFITWLNNLLQTVNTNPIKRTNILQDRTLFYINLTKSNVLGN